MVDACDLISRPSPCILRQILVFLCQFLCVPLKMVFLLLQSSPIVPYSWVMSCMSIGSGGGVLEGGVDSNGWVCAVVCDAILARNIYCAKPNNGPNSHYCSRVHKGLRDWSLHINLEYDLTTAISIRPFTHTVTCEMGSSIFSAMIWIKVDSSTNVSLTIIPSTKRKNREKCFCLS